MELAGKIITLLVVLAPILVAAYMRYFSVQAAARKRLEEKNKAIQKEREKLQQEATKFAEVHDRQEGAEDLWRKSKK